MSVSPICADDIHDEMVRWRHDIHQHPELGFAEHKTSAKVARLLADFGLEVHSGVGETGVVGVLKRGTGGGSIGLRADMDALSITEENTFSHASKHVGQMHACGHDGHTAMLLGAAKVLSQSDTFEGCVVFIFQPAEEHGRGALAMIEDGLFERFPVDCIYAIHNMPSIPTGHFFIRPGPVMACEDNFEIEIFGKGGHAALPHLAVDPIVIASQIVIALQTVVSRCINPTEGGVLSVTDFCVEGIKNVIPEKVILRGDVRSFTPEIQSQIEAAMDRITSGICEAAGATCSFTYSHEFAATINSADETQTAISLVRQMFGEDRILTDRPPMMTSEDFAFMLQRKPGCYILLGNGGEGSGGCGLHSAHYDFNDDILATGVDFWVGLVHTLLKGKN